MATDKITSPKKTGWVFFNTIDPHICTMWSNCRYVWIEKSGLESDQINFILRFAEGKIYFLRVEDSLHFLLESDLDDIRDYQRFTLKKQSLNIDKNKIAFFIANDTIAKTMLPIIQRVRKATVTNCYTPTITKEDADTVLASNDIDYCKFNTARILIYRPNIIIMGCDWSGEAKYIIALCRLMGIKTICLQESIIDLKDQNVRRMKWTDIVFIMGASAVGQLERKLYFITGNPRYERLMPVEAVKEHHKAFINCNFTYGYEEDVRSIWLNQIVKVLEAAKIDYIISQHPRDKGDLSQFNNVRSSSAEIVHSQLKECTFVISRFSSIIHEALFLEKPVIYYNPHNEKIGYEFFFDNNILNLCNSSGELKQVVEFVITRTPLKRNDVEQYLAVNCNLIPIMPSEIISKLLISLGDFKGDGIKISLLQGLFYYARQHLSGKKREFLKKG